VNADYCVGGKVIEKETRGQETGTKEQGARARNKEQETRDKGKVKLEIWGVRHKHLPFYPLTSGSLNHLLRTL
jgi:hypothetical protein